ncbi:uncharacterized protein N7496_012066 [Penicillium cataractarum]|uniref:Uncharacterized protein n=1 Tax=Penicillium cataractarum TaxID=2100454 RepID=A0A9W9RLB1_9EURO|nr:uncharacterized protein N7496_012066 [Penicillium cataractarum]KAJ5359653.1 hypothetical protein N7496_012066 [Penicillium cataractarum]
MDASTGAGAALALNLSDDGLYAAHVNGKDLIVYTNPASEDKEAQVARIKENGVKYLKFCPVTTSSTGLNHNTERRLLSANDTRISVWQLEPLQIFAEIENLEPGALSIDFGSDGNEILVFHAWNTKVTIHSLDTGRISVIKTPKGAHPLGFGYRPNTRQLAILLKPDASDLLTIHEHKTHELVGRAVLPTVDAQGLKWSPDGKWLAVWDVASGGTKVLIFTADGQLFRTYTGPTGADDAFDLGVKQIEWSSVAGTNGASEVLAVGKVNGNIDLLRTRTFSSSITLSHVFPADQHAPSIWRERFTSALGDADYVETSSSSASNMSPESSGLPRGITIMTFSSDGTLLATVDSMRSNVVWIWALDGSPRLASALVHEQPVRQLAWHPSTPQLLINTITNNLPTIRWWSPNAHPVIARVPTHKSESGKYEVKWLAESEPDSAFWFASTEEYVVGYLSAEDDLVKFEVLNSVTSQGYGGHAGSMMSR